MVCVLEGDFAQQSLSVVRMGKAPSNPYRLPPEAIRGLCRTSASQTEAT
jgi:hypothetical protein